MSNFKIGQRVVFVGCEKQSTTGNYPNLNEIVTIKSFCDTYKGYLDILEYPKNKLGIPQSISPKYLRPLDEDFATETLARITKQVKEEQLITTL